MFKSFNRVKEIVKSEINVMFDNVEDPVKKLEQFMRKMETDILNAQDAVEKQTNNEKRLKQQYSDAQALVERRQRKAKKALEELARRTHQDIIHDELRAKSLRENLEQTQNDLKVLKNTLCDLKSEYQELELKRDSLKERAESA